MKVVGCPSNQEPPLSVVGKILSALQVAHPNGEVHGLPNSSGQSNEALCLVRLCPCSRECIVRTETFGDEKKLLDYPL